MFPFHLSGLEPVRFLLVVGGGRNHLLFLGESVPTILPHSFKHIQKEIEVTIFGTNIILFGPRVSLLP